MEQDQKVKVLKTNEVEKNFKSVTELTVEEIEKFNKVRVDFTAVKYKNSDEARYSYVVFMNDYTRLNEGRDRKEYLTSIEHNLLTLKLLGQVNYDKTFTVERPYRLVKGIGKNGKSYYAMQIWFTKNFVKMIFLDSVTLDFLRGAISKKLIKLFKFELASDLEDQKTEVLNGFEENSIEL